MNPYATRGQARIRQRDIDGLVRTYGFLTAASLAEIERQRGRQAEAEVEWLLKQHGVRLNAAARLRQALGAALVRAGARVAGTPRGVGLPETPPVAGTIGTAS
jgi:hypothetical protein